MLRSVAVLVLDELAVFEFGVLCEVFGLDRTDDGVPLLDFRVCGCAPASRSAPPAACRSSPNTGWRRCAAPTSSRCRPRGCASSRGGAAGAARRLRRGRDAAHASAPGCSCSAPPACWTAAGAPRTG